VFDAHRDDPEFGYQFLADEARLAGHAVCDRSSSSRVLHRRRSNTLRWRSTTNDSMAALSPASRPGPWSRPSGDG
jgi:hypothetical protein